MFQGYFPPNTWEGNTPPKCIKPSVTSVNVTGVTIYVDATKWNECKEFEKLKQFVQINYPLTKTNSKNSTIGAC